MSTARAALDAALLATPLDPVSCVFRSVSRTARVVAGVYDRAFAPLGLTAGQFNLLMTLARLGTISVGDLAGQLSADGSTIPRLLAPLLTAGHISISRGRDRRVRMLTVTARGCSKLRAALPRWQAVQAELIARLESPDWETLRTSLRTLHRVARATAH
jgi:DNA-binding MarR family transcriptional regulator